MTVSVCSVPTLVKVYTQGTRVAQSTDHRLTVFKVANRLIEDHTDVFARLESPAMSTRSLFRESRADVLPDIGGKEMCPVLSSIDHEVLEPRSHSVEPAQSIWKCCLLDDLLLAGCLYM